MVIDPSGKGQVDSDHSGMVVVDAGVDKKLYLRYGKRQLITDMALADWIIDTALLFYPSTIGIEDNKFLTMSELLEIRVEQRLREGTIPDGHKEYARTIPYILSELRPMGRPKEVRIKNMTGFVEHGQVLFPIEGTEHLEDEMIRYPSSNIDDTVDAFGYLYDIMYFPKKTDPPKLLHVPDELKMTQQEREKKEWEEIREFHRQELYRGFEDDIDLY
jgi:hypothetical protein